MLNSNNWKQQVHDLEDFVSQEEADELIYQIAANELKRNGVSDNDPNYQNKLFEEMDYINVFAIRKESQLYDALVDYYQDKNKSMEEGIRTFFDDGSNIYFTSGLGYALYDADLLDGRGDGQTEKLFNTFLDQRETALQQQSTRQSAPKPAAPQATSVSQDQQAFSQGGVPTKQTDNPNHKKVI